MEGHGNISREAAELRLIDEALQGLPPAYRPEYVGAAFLRLRHLQQKRTPPNHWMPRVRYHVQYLYKCDRQRRGRRLLPLPSAIPTHPTKSMEEQLDIKEKIAHLNNQQRAVLALLLAGHTLTGIQKVRGCRFEKVVQTLADLRSYFHAYQNAR